jgi:tetratricopeptide (TPR) repeat protein
MTDDIDFSAWEAPEPPEDLAESVIARIGGTGITPAVPVEEPTLRRRAMLIGGVAVAVLALTIGAWALVRSTDRAAPTDGVVVAKHAQPLVLDGVRADLDQGADVKWARRGNTVRVQQRSGTAAWRVDGDQQLVIAAGASTVEANGGANLRVEVKMNAVTGAVGAGLFAAAAVVTVVVYNGSVTVEKPNRERVIVAPGTTYTVAPEVVNPVTIACNLDTCILDNFSGPCCDKHKPAARLTPELVRETMTALHDQLDACGQSYSANASVDVQVNVRGDGSVASVIVAKTPDVALGECVSQVISGARFHASQQAMTVFSFPVVLSAPAATCDADKPKDEGMEAVNMGEHAKALALFEKSLACKKDSFVVALAFMAACNTANASKARTYYGKLTKAQQSKYEVMCARNGIDVSTTCDADALKEKGMEHVNMGEHSAALAMFEHSLKCKPDSYVTSLAFMAACNAGNATKARALYARLPTKMQSSYKVMCDRNGVDVNPGCDADKLKDDGMKAVNDAEHAKALTLFEQSLACKSDPIVTQLAFMSACNAKNGSKARALYGQLTDAQRHKFKAICIRNNVDLDDDAGYLQVSSKPAAKILIDGKDTGRTTPLELALVPGKHKVTFVVGRDRYTYAVTIKAGQTESMTKDLQ